MHQAISYLRRHGYPRIVGALKGKGSVEDGVEHIRGFSGVVIHPQAEAAIEEFRLYSYKIDKRSGQVLADLVDANNHVIDALRYALEKVMRARSTVGLMVPARLRRK